MCKLFKSGILLMIFHLAAVPSFSQSYYPNIYHNLLPYNAAYAGEDSTSMALSTFFGVEEISENYRGLEFSASHHLKKLKSGIGLMAHRNVFGENEGSHELTANQVSLIYNYKITFNETSWIRLGIKVNENINTYNFVKIYKNAPYTVTIPYDTTIDYISIDPGVWFVWKNMQVGFSMQNILNAELFQSTATKGYAVITSYKAIIRDNFKLDITALYQHTTVQNGKGNDITPELTFDLWKILIVDAGMHFYSNKILEYKSSGNNFVAGVGVHIIRNVKFLASYYVPEKDGNGRIAAMLKCNF